MNQYLTIFYTILISVTIAYAVIYLIIGLQKGSEKTYLLLGIIGICVGIYYYFSYFSNTRNGVYSWPEWLSFFFFLANFALLPWFFGYYTGYKKPSIQWILSAGMFVTYLLLIATNDPSPPLIWNIFGHVILLGILIFGFIAANFQRKEGHSSSAWFLIVALAIFSVITVDDIWYIHFRNFYPFNHSPHFLPLDYFLVLFMIIMGIKLIRDIQQKYILQYAINIREKRWKNLLEKVELVVVELNKDGSVNYINPHFEKITGYKKEDVCGKNWFELFIPENEKEGLMSIFEKSFNKDPSIHYRNSILTRNNEKLRIEWSNVLLENEQGDVVSSLSIGSDVTDQEKANEEIRLLKEELEKENILLKAEISKITSDEKIIGKSEALRYVLQRARQVAPTDSIVLLEGETGVGKELIANYIQSTSLRSDKPYIKVNCAAIPSTLLESELFGHVRGAFTGADKNKKGMVELANKGTLFLDEIGEFPLELQPKLLRFLQEGEFMPLGSEKANKVDVRIITATNKELLKQIEEGAFRNDLYYRLAVFPITIPPLRSRKLDIPELIDLFVKKYALKHRKPIKKVSQQVIDELTHYHWPGNIRELENVIERAVIISTGDTLKTKDIHPGFGKTMNGDNKEPGIFLTFEEQEREYILKALKKTNWQIHGTNGAASLLNINPSTLRSKIKKLGIRKSN